VDHSYNNSTEDSIVSLPFGGPKGYTTGFYREVVCMAVSAEIVKGDRTVVTLMLNLDMPVGAHELQKFRLGQDLDSIGKSCGAYKEGGESS
jgi:hypothetical protein